MSERVQRREAIAIVVACLGGWVLGPFVSPGYAGIRGSAHDFRSPDAISSDAGSSTEVCVFCHTPIGEQPVATAPLWNPQAARWVFERQATFGNAALEQSTGSVGPVSLTCFACHDGVQAVDVGSVSAVVPDAGSMLGSGYGLANGPLSPFNREADGSGNHPTMIPYASGRCRGVDADCDPGALPVVGVSFRPVQSDVINSVRSWWVDTAEGVTGQRDRSDIMLYAREDQGAVGPAVECGSCHDPHDGRRRPVSFLRLDASDSTLCLACHAL